MEPYRRRDPKSSSLNLQFHGSRGASIIELAAVVPFTLIMIAGVIEIGRLLTKADEVANAAYQGAVTLSETPRFIGSQGAEGRAQNLIQLHSQINTSFYDTGSVQTSADYFNNNTSRLTLSAELRTFFDLIPLRLSASNVSAGLLRDPADPSLNLNLAAFGNSINGNFYDCNGIDCNMGGACPPPDCATAGGGGNNDFFSRCSFPAGHPLYSPLCMELN
ncbi:MAG: hypothetical protein DCC75_00020 [Proteobacteria bacterium]|nr:MAG: hypothetical protein DCC75_00020 [Pseudomonadota bacterium]